MSFDAKNSKLSMKCFFEWGMTNYFLHTLFVIVEGQILM